MKKMKIIIKDKKKGSNEEEVYNTGHLSNENDITIILHDNGWLFVIIHSTPFIINCLFQIVSLHKCVHL